MYSTTAFKDRRDGSPQGTVFGPNDFKLCEGWVYNFIVSLAGHNTETYFKTC